MWSRNIFLCHSHIPFSDEDILKVIVGCKSDEASNSSREVSKEEGQTLAIGHNARYWECSAKDGGPRIQGVFESLASSIMAVQEVNHY